MQRHGGFLGARDEVLGNRSPVEVARAAQIRRIEQLAQREAAIDEGVIGELGVGDAVDEPARCAWDREPRALDGQLDYVVANLRRGQKPPILDVERIYVELDRGGCAGPTKWRIVMMSREGIVVELQI